MSENSIGLKTQVLEGLLKQTLGQRYYAFSSGITLCYAGSGWDSEHFDLQPVRAAASVCGWDLRQEQFSVRSSFPTLREPKTVQYKAGENRTARRDVAERGYRLEGTWHHRMADPVTTPVF